MKKRIHRLRRKIKRAGGVDLVLTHAPVYGFGDEDDLCHMGFECFRELIDEFHPRYLIHGHVHRNYSQAIERSYEYNGTIITNVFKRHIIEID